MGVRETLNKKQSVSVGLSILFVVLAAGIIVYSRMPEHRFAGKTSFYSDDDGSTWFIDSYYKSTPFDHNGNQAVHAVIYSYDHGNKTFCAYLMRHSAADKKRIDDAVADAARQGKPPSSVGLFEDKGIANDMEIRQPGPSHPWVAVQGPDAQGVEDAVLKDHDDGTLDIVYAE
jgi:hypothetical protein